MPSIGPWCGGKCLPPKVIGCGFESGNQPLQRKIWGKDAYQSPLLGPAKVEVLCTKYDLYVHSN